MQSLDIFKISQEAKETLADPELFRHRLDNGETLLDLFGFSDDALMGFYDAAVLLLEEKRFEDASDAFYFLATLLPNESLFWLGVARSDWHAGKPIQAVGSYLMALGLKPFDAAIFTETLGCCLSGGTPETAEKVIEQVLEQAAADPDSSEAQKIIGLAKQAQQELERLQQVKEEESE